MKVDRIVGIGEMTLGDILRYRISKYQKLYDLRVLVEPGSSVEHIADQVQLQLAKSQDFYTTRFVSLNFSILPLSTAKLFFLCAQDPSHSPGMCPRRTRSISSRPSARASDPTAGCTCPSLCPRSA